MDDILKQQLEMYERGDIDALEQILSSVTMSSYQEDDDEEVTIISEFPSTQISTNHLDLTNIQSASASMKDQSSSIEKLLSE